MLNKVKSGVIGAVIMGCTVFGIMDGHVDELENTVRERDHEIDTHNTVRYDLLSHIAELESDAVNLNNTVTDLKSQNEELESKISSQNKKQEEQKQVVNSTPAKTKTQAHENSNMIDFVATAYCGCAACNGQWVGYPTASGTDYVAGRTIAVDPNVIPLGTQVEIEGMGTYTAEDTGSAIKGNIVDIYFNSHSEAMAFGRQNIRLRY